MKQILGAAALLLLALPAWPEPVRLTGRIEPAGAPGVRVELLPYVQDHAQALRSLGGQPPEPLATARPAADGRFELSAPEPGFYVLAARAEGFLEMRSALVPLFEETELPPVRLPKAGTLDLTVLDPSGKSAAGIRVQAWARSSASGGSGWSRAPRQGTSGTEGRLTLPWVRGEELELMASSPEFFGSTGAAKEGTAVLRLRRAPLVAVEARDAAGRPLPGALLRLEDQVLAVTGRDGRIAPGLPAVGVGIWLEAPDGRRAMLTLPPGERASRTVTLSSPEMLTGRVVDARTRAPLPGALVWSQAQGTFSQTRAGAGGSFRLAAAPGQNPVLAAGAHGYVAALQGPGTPDGATLALQPAAVLTGSVVDAADAPVADALVRALPEEGSFGLLPEPQARTDSTGRFRLRGLAAGASWRVRAFAKGLAPGEQVAMTAEPGQSAPPLRIVLGSGTSLTGRLVDPAGQPVPGAEAVLQPATMTSQEDELRATSEADGRFRFAHLGAGRFGLRIEHPGFAPAARKGLEVSGRPTALDLGDLRLTPGATIEGRVTDEQRRPVEQAFISAVSSNPLSGAAVSAESVRTGADGRFRIAGLTPGQRVDVHVEHPDYIPFEAPGVEAPRADPFDVILRTGRTLTGRVMDGERRPVQARISRLESMRMSFGGSMSSSWGEGTAGTSDEEGRFVLGRLAAGTVDLKFEADGFRAKTVPGIRIPETEDPAPLEVVLEPESALEGRVLTAAGAPAGGLWISMMRIDRQRLDLETSSGQTDADGRYRIGRLGPGAYEVHAFQGRGAPPVRTKISLSAGETRRLDLTLPPGDVRVEGTEASGLEPRRLPEEAVPGQEEPAEGLTLSGHLFLDGEPLAGAEVGVAPAEGGGPQTSARSRYDGGFTFERLQPGSLVLVVLAGGMGQARKIELASDQDVTIDLRTGLVTGHVLTTGGQPVAGAAVALQGEDSGLAFSFAVPGMLTDERGAFETRLAMGSYRLTATGEGFAPVLQTIVVTPGGTTEVQVVVASP